MPEQKKLFLTVFLLLTALILINCGGDDEEKSKSMAEIQNDEGVPVVVETVRKQYFKKELTFFSRLSGIQQTTRTSAVGGRIEKINFKVGDFVKKDDIVVEFPIDNPAIQYEQAKAAYENSKKNYERMKTLLVAGETSQANFDGAETKYLVDKRNFETAKQALFIDAPYDGVIVEIMVNEGDGIDSKIPLFTVARLDKMKAKLWASEDEVKQIKKGMTAELLYDGEIYEGKVTEISIAVDPAKRAFSVEVEFDNGKRKLSPGLSTEIAVKVYENKEAIIVPRNLIQTNGETKYVFIVKDGAAEMRKLTTGEENGLYIEVTDGLLPGDKLIVKGVNRVTDGQKINVVQ